MSRVGIRKRVIFSAALRDSDAIRPDDELLI